mmetsp:Transcript_19321/g.26725  ORF Transcript_19321/g.26725 Transcript_19321/m.26725 type:complete len:160 (-) Transcript_19321:149-628(-)
MKKHFKIVGSFKPLSDKLQALKAAKDTAESVEDAEAKETLSHSEKSLVLSLAIKIADLGHLRAPALVHRAFTTCLLNEFYNQGDQLRELGREVGPMFTRSPECDIPDQQRGFFEVFALPLASCWTQIADSRWYADIEENYLMWGKDIIKFKKKNEAENG